MPEGERPRVRASHSPVTACRWAALWLLREGEVCWCGVDEGEQVMRCADDGLEKKNRERKRKVKAQTEKVAGRKR